MYIPHKFTNFNTPTEQFSSMINRRWSNSNVNREHVQRLLNKTASIVEWRATIQLSRWHPEFVLRVNPHRIDPEKTLVVNERRPCAVGRDFQYLLSIVVADIDVALRVNCCATYTRSVNALYPLMDVCRLTCRGSKRVWLCVLRQN